MVRTTLSKAIPVLVLFSIVWISCSETRKSAFKSDNGIEFDTVQTEEQYFLDNKPENPSCNLTIKLSVPAKSTHFDIEPIRKIFVSTALGSDYENMSADEAVKKYARAYIENYQSDAEIYKVNKPSGDYSESFDDIYLTDSEHSNLPDIFYSYFENISNDVVFNQYGVLSFQVVQQNNKGGRVSHESIRNYVIDLAGGVLLSDGDLFSAGYDEALRPIIQNLLMEKQSVKTIQQLEDLGYFGIDEIVPNKNFLITKEGITYTFNKGEYSAYQLPAANILIPFSSVRSLLRENSIAGKLSRMQ